MSIFIVNTKIFPQNIFNFASPWSEPLIIRRHAEGNILYDRTPVRRSFSTSTGPTFDKLWPTLHMLGPTFHKLYAYIT